MTLFKKIIDGQLPCEKLFENDRLIAIKDKYPVAPVHILIIPKKIIPSLQAVSEADLPLIGEIVALAQRLAKEFQIETGYRFLTNTGENAGQTIAHLHFHLIGGDKLSPL
jgi:histidine triad (HIT) family protein